MTYRFFIDECLSPELVSMARDAGYEATCSRNRGLLGMKDWDLVTLVVAADYTFVTHNSNDFRGEGGDDPGGLYAKQNVHPGLICLNSHFAMDIPRQRTLFGYALRELALREDLINRAVEVFEDEAGQVTVDIYLIPTAPL